MNDIYASLNPEQKLAVDTIDGPLLILAGPGTGKTQLLSARAMRILEVTDTPPSAILCLTFTENGAENMRDRLSRFIGEAAYQVAIHTYHGFAQTIISQFPDFFTDKNLQTIIDPITQYQLIDELKSTMASNNILAKIDNRDILATIGELKNALLGPKELHQIARFNQAELERINPLIHDLTKDIKQFRFKFDQGLALFQQLAEILTPPERSPLPQIQPISFHPHRELEKALEQATASGKLNDLTAWRSKFLPKDDQGRYGLTDNFNFYRLTHLADLMEQYQTKVKAAGLYDFNDMILEVIDTIETCDELRFNLQEKYLYIMLDEYQDTNRAQSKLIELLADAPVHEGRPNIMAVGDDDQAIFAFQGADYSNMLNFYQRYRDTQLINLSRNYRSAQAILDFSTNLAEQISDRLTSLIDDKSLQKTLVAANSTLPAPDIRRLDFASKTAEYKYLADSIAALIKNGVNPNEIAVLSARHRTLEACTPFLLKQAIPINYERSQNVLDNAGIQAMLKIAELVNALARHHAHNHLAFEVFSYDLWGLNTTDVWQLSWQTSRDQSCLEVIINQPQFNTMRRPALWLLELASQINRLSLEAAFDALVGNISLKIKDGDQELELTSPLKQHFQNQSDEALFEFSLCLNLLRERFLSFAQNYDRPEMTPTELLVELASLHQTINQPILFTNPYRNNQQAVSLMTAFKAKGLEFQHVFLLETNNGEWGGANSGRNMLALPDNLRFIRHEKTTVDEQLRLLFVAVSRAKTNLYLLNSTKNDQQKPVKRLEFLAEVETDSGEFVANTIPAPFNLVRSQEVAVDSFDIELELFDNFHDWKNRHLQAALSFPQLLEPRLRNFRLSPTSFNSFLNLEYGGPAEFFLSQILRFPGAFDLRPTYGSLIHAVLDHAQKTTDFQIEHIMDFFRHKLAELRLTEADRQTLLNWGESSLPLFLEQRRELFNPTNKVETEVRIGTPPAVLNGALLGGAVDRIEFDETAKTITLVDYKTGKSRDRINANDSSLYGYITQLYFYKIMLEASAKYHSWNITGWRLEFLSPTPDGRVNHLAGEFDSATENKVKRLISAVWRRVLACDFSAPELPANLAGRKQFEELLLDPPETKPTSQPVTSSNHRGSSLNQSETKLTTEQP